MAAAPVVIAAMEPAQSALISRKSWPKKHDAAAYLKILGPLNGP
jgi:hypothetical protein